MTLLFIIDMQNDFCNPAGSLYVPGAEGDVQRLSNLIVRKGTEINDIILTQDNHQVMDIAHPGFWVNADNEHPQPFTNITYKDVKEGVWTPVLFQHEATDYLFKLEESGEYPHTIWPEHCIWGSTGAAMHPVLMNEVMNWSRTGKMFEVVTKGANPLTEHFGAFRANIPLVDFAETQFNKPLLEKMRLYDNILIAGEAKSHCVANTIKQLFDYPEIFSKIFILEDCMSNVSGCDMLAVDIYRKAGEMGAKFVKSTEI